ncbi:hypothetical protein ACFLYL_04685 [Chloroflexota bacterium]
MSGQPWGTGVPADKVNEDCLHCGLDTLYVHKSGFRKHIKEKPGELFDLEHDMLLYR